MAEDNSSYASIPPVHQQNSSLEFIVDTENKQLDSSSSSSSSALLSSNKLPTGKLEFSCCSKKGCQNVFTKTIGRIEDEKRRGNTTGIYYCSECSNCAEHTEDSIETEASAGMYMFFLLALNVIKFNVLICLSNFKPQRDC